MSGAVFWATFFIVFWLIFFMTLPFGVRPPEHPEPGHMPSAPERPYLWAKALVALVLAYGATWGIDWIIAAGWFDVRPKEMPW